MMRLEICDEAFRIHALRIEQQKIPWWRLLREPRPFWEGFYCWSGTGWTGRNVKL